MEFELLETNKENKIIIDKLMTDYGIATKELNSEWERRSEELERRIKRALCEKEEACLELTRLAESMSTIKHEHELEMKELINRMKRDLVSQFHFLPKIGK